MIALRPLRESDERSFLMAHDSFKKSDPDLFFSFDFDRTKPFAEYVAKMNDWQKGRNLPANHVPCTFLVAEANGHMELQVSIPGIDRAVAQSLVEKAHHVCPYSNATRGNIEVVLTVL